MSEVGKIILGALVLLPLPVSAYVVGNIFDQFFPKMHLRIYSIFLFVLTLALLFNSGMVEEIYLQLDSSTTASFSSLSAFLLVVGSTILFSSFLASGIVLLSVTIFEVLFNTATSTAQMDFSGFSACIRPYLVIAFFSFTFNITMTFAVDRLSPFSLLKLVGG